MGIDIGRALAESIEEREKTICMYRKRVAKLEAELMQMNEQEQKDCPMGAAWTKQQLCDRIVELEAELADAKKCGEESAAEFHACLQENAGLRRLCNEQEEQLAARDARITELERALQGASTLAEMCVPSARERRSKMPKVLDDGQLIHMTEPEYISLLECELDNKDALIADLQAQILKLTRKPRRKGYSAVIAPREDVTPEARPEAGRG